MGAVGEPGAPGNTWRSADDFPPPTKLEPLYLRKDRSLSTTASAVAEHISWNSDPRSPMQIPGQSFPELRMRDHSNLSPRS